MSRFISILYRSKQKYLYAKSYNNFEQERPQERRSKIMSCCPTLWQAWWLVSWPLSWSKVPLLLLLLSSLWSDRTVSMHTFKPSYNCTFDTLRHFSWIKRIFTGHPSIVKSCGRERLSKKRNKYLAFYVSIVKGSFIHALNVCSIYIVANKVDNNFNHRN